MTKRTTFDLNREQLVELVWGLDKQVAELLAALRAIEWIKDRDGEWFCPRCEADREYGHYGGCQLAQALARARSNEETEA
jgi:hypothetical protein